jgi:hypothetical protein
MPQKASNGSKAFLGLLTAILLVMLANEVRISISLASIQGNHWTSSQQAAHVKAESDKHETLVERIHQLELKLKVLEGECRKR